MTIKKRITRLYRQARATNRGWNLHYTKTAFRVDAAIWIGMSGLLIKGLFDPRISTVSSLLTLVLICWSAINLRRILNIDV